MPAKFPDMVGSTPRPTMNNHVNGVATEDDIVISGMSAYLPESENVAEFKDILFNGVDMMNNKGIRWEAGLLGLPTRNGIIKNLNKFDNTYFGVHAKQADVMDPQIRMVLECTMGAMLDAGVNPTSRRGMKVGVFSGCSISDATEIVSYDLDKIHGYEITGCCHAMIANRVSYHYDLKGPSFSVDAACAASTHALNQAVLSMRTGQCDEAVVTGSTIILLPSHSLQFHRLGMLAPDGKCKAFDVAGDGYVRSESVVVIYLQRASVAKRSYATLLHMKTNSDGYKEEGITYPSGAMQQRLIKEVYEEAGLEPSQVSYVEAHGTGTRVGDPEEINGIVDIFCKNRDKPLLIGSLKSNMGHPEAASGLTSIVKILLAMEAGELPPNLHYKNPNPKIHGLIDGRLKVVDKRQPWNGGIVALNNFGFGGANTHTILKSNPKKKDSAAPQETPVLVPVMGRTQEMVDMVVQEAQKHVQDREFISLLHELSSKPMPGFNHRGFTVLGGSENVQETKKVGSERPPVWFVCSGMGSQWPAMAKDMMKFQVFERSINRSADLLRPFGIDLKHLLLETDQSIYDNILHSFVTIASAQVALLDLLKAMDIEPDGILGHSVGEVVCAYADGCFSADQTVLAAYWRGRAILDTKLPMGLMASVGLSFEEAKARVPEDIIIACHNSVDNVTLSGPIESIQKFVAKLKSEGIFAKEVNTANRAFHSKYIADAGPYLRTNLEKVIPTPKSRTQRWLSTSIPEKSWNLPLAKDSSAAYHVNNLLSPVLFEETLLHIPEGSIVVEIAPHCLLQPILKRALGNCFHTGLMKRGHPDNAEFFLNATGRLFLSGLNPDVAKLYKPVSFPVSRSTPMISPLLRWDHKATWEYFDTKKTLLTRGHVEQEVNMQDMDHAYLNGHTIDGRVLYPATGYLKLVWDIFARNLNTTYDKLPVIFEDVAFQRATILPKDGAVKFYVNILQGTGEFEVFEGGSVAVKGRVSTPEDNTIEMKELPKHNPDTEKDELPLEKEDIYKELRLRGYEYSGLFQSIIEADNRGRHGTLEWKNNWVSFLDTMLQFTILGKDGRGLYLPTRMQRMAIDPKLHQEVMSKITDKGVSVIADHLTNIVQAGGVEMQGMKASPAPRKHNITAPNLEKYHWEPYLGENEPNGNKANLRTLVKLLADIVIENCSASKLKVVEAAEAAVGKEHLLSTLVAQGMQVEPMIRVEGTVAAGAGMNGIGDHQDELNQLGLQPTEHDLTTAPLEAVYDLSMSYNALGKAKGLLDNLIASVHPRGFVLLAEDKFGTEEEKKIKVQGMEVVGRRVLQEGQRRLHLALLRRPQKEQKLSPIVVRVEGQDYSWVDKVKAALFDASENEREVVLVAQGDPYNGIVGLSTCLRRESGGEYLRCFLLLDKTMPSFDLARPEYANKLRQGLLMNVARQGQWGSFRHLALGSPMARRVPHSYANVLTRGDLSSLRWVQGPLGTAKDEGLCQVHYAPLNFRDVMLASGKLPPDALPGNAALQDCLLGLEFSGSDNKGKRVMGLVEARGLATVVHPDPNFLWEVPSGWTLEEASTVPVVYATAYYALLMRGNLKAGESVLIHSGSGGVGQAAISIALSMGCRVFTTVGSESKRTFLRSRFPQLSQDSFANSRDTSFEQHVLRHTAGQGVDLVLNSLAEDKLQASLRCLAQHGRFLEIGKFDLANNTPLGMALFLKNITFHGVLLDALFEDRMDEKKELVRLVREGLTKGVVKPLPRTVFEAEQLEEAFRFMASGKHMGKVVVRICPEKDSKTISEETPEALPRTHLDETKTYVILGGLGGFGLELAGWMVERGARRLVLTGRRGLRNGYQALCVRRWRQRGVQVVVSTADAGTEEGARKLLTEANKLGQVGAIVNSALVLRDGLMDNQNQENFKAVAHPKAQATILLDQLSRKMCPSLDHFVVFSSVSCGRGNAGQANYGMANSVMERVCEQRRRDGLPALAVQWGAVGDVGVVNDTMGGNDVVIGGTLPQRITSCLTTLDQLLQQQEPVVSSIVLADKKSSHGGAEKGTNILEAVCHILGVKDKSTLEQTASLTELGLDSLMGVEVKQLLERDCDVVLSMKEIRHLTIQQLDDMSVNKPVKESSDPEETSVPFADLLAVEGTPMTSVIVPKQVVRPLAPVPKSGTPVFVAHPMEGNSGRLEELAALLHCPIYGLEGTPTVPLESIESMASFYIREMRKCHPKGPYLIAGYSFGAAVAFEMALQLEAENPKLVKAMVLLDGSPNYVGAQMRHYYKKYNRRSEDAVTHAEILCAYINRFFPVDFQKMKEEILTGTGPEERRNVVISKLSSHFPSISTSDFNHDADAFVSRMKASAAYLPTKHFKGQAVLIRAKDNDTVTTEDLELGQVCDSKPALHIVDGNHQTFLAGAGAKKVCEIFVKVLS